MTVKKKNLEYLWFMTFIVWFGLVWNSPEYPLQKKKRKERFHKDAMVLTKHSETEDTH